MAPNRNGDRQRPNRRGRNPLGNNPQVAPQRPARSQAQSRPEAPSQDMGAIMETVNGVEHTIESASTLQYNLQRLVRNWTTQQQPAALQVDQQPQLDQDTAQLLQNVMQIVEQTYRASGQLRHLKHQVREFRRDHLQQLNQHHAMVAENTRLRTQHDLLHTALAEEVDNRDNNLLPRIKKLQRWAKIDRRAEEKGYLIRDRVCHPMNSDWSNSSDSEWSSDSNDEKLKEAWNQCQHGNKGGKKGGKKDGE